VPVRPKDQKEWSTYFDENCIVCSTQKRAYEPSQHIRVVTPVPPDDGETISPSHAKLHEMARQLSGSFWKDKKIEKLFNSLDVVSSLNDWIDQLKIAEFDVFALKQLVNKSDASPLEMHHIPLLQIKIMYLRRAYEFALQDMPPPSGASWEACCQRSINFLKAFVDKIHSN